MTNRDEVLIVNPIELKEKIVDFWCPGPDLLQIISDWDRTLTKAKVNGKNQSTNSVIDAYLPKEFQERCSTLFDIYYPIETDHSIADETKLEILTNWWKSKFDMFLEIPLDEKIATELAPKDIVARENLPDLIKILQANNIPMLILSAGIGNVIEQYLSINGYIIGTNGSKNPVVGSNFLEFKDGKAKSYSSLMTVINKSFDKAPDEYKKKTTSKKNIILLGDSPHDIKMTDGFQYSKIIRVGFVNNDYEREQKIHEQLYDILIFKDGSLRPVVDLIRYITDGPTDFVKKYSKQ